MDRSGQSGGDHSSSSWINEEPAPGQRCLPRDANMAVAILGSILALAVLCVSSVSCSRIPDKYPIEVHHMLQERTQFGYGRDNRVRGTWDTWSAWSECSRTCGTGIQSQSRECVPFRIPLRRRRSAILASNTSNVRPICVGTYKRYHTCNTQECPNFSEDLRVEQCAKYNGKNYKGFNYVWVPFLDASNSCALNCRAVGERFYATLEPAVMDGTPCDRPNLRGHNAGISMERTERWLCVAGQCKPVGCDGVVGSGVAVDSCGVCGGQGKGCRLFEGIFMEPKLTKGHQPITTIPKGAMSLNISELRFSANFLALRDSNGSYILNGPWSYSPSGTYKAAGTTLTYQRGDRTRMECILATGPLNESLHLEILYRELNPGVLYKYMLPMTEAVDGRAIIAPPLLASGPNEPGNEIPAPTGLVTMAVPVTRISDRHADLSSTDHDRGRGRVREDGRREEMKHPPTTVMAGDQPKSKGKKKKKKRRRFAWKVVSTLCSKECGEGVQTALFKCVRESNQLTVNEKRCKNVEKPVSPPPLRCNQHPCAARWRAEPWSECSVSCNTGTRTRRLECVQELNAKLTMRVAAGACIQPPDLRTVENCTKPACPSGAPELRHMHPQHDGPRWNVGVWGPCSRTCGPGTRSRKVTCITSGQPCSPLEKPESQKNCENTPCKGEGGQHAPWLYSKWSNKCSVECGSGVETRRVACADGSELFCNPKERPEAERHCFGRETNCDSARWFTGPWTPCSVTCGMGVQHREILCLSRRDNEFIVRLAKDCNDTKPASEQICIAPMCYPEWFTSNWSECSATCGGGVQTRLVRCIPGDIPRVSCVETAKPIEQQRCNTEPCKEKLVAPTKPSKKTPESAECADKYPYCNLVVKNGLCRINYYKHSCCQCRD